MHLALCSLILHFLGQEFWWFRHFDTEEIYITNLSFLYVDNFR